MYIEEEVEGVQMDEWGKERAQTRQDQQEESNNHKSSARVKAEVEDIHSSFQADWCFKHLVGQSQYQWGGPTVPHYSTSWIGPFCCCYCSITVNIL